MNSKRTFAFVALLVCVVLTVSAGQIGFSTSYARSFANYVGQSHEDSIVVCLKHSEKNGMFGFGESVDADIKLTGHAPIDPVDFQASVYGIVALEVGKFDVEAHLGIGEAFINNDVPVYQTNGVIEIECGMPLSSRMNISLVSGCSMPILKIYGDTARFCKAESFRLTIGLAGSYLF